MMKLAVTLLLLSSAAFAAESEQFVVKPVSKDGSTACEKKVDALIRKTAQQMGYTKKFGLHLTAEAAGSDLNDKPLTNYKSGVFIVEDGYLSNSSSSATVRDPDKSCDIVKLFVSIGG